MKIVHQELDEQAWRTFVDNHPHSNIFHTPEMFKVFARTKGHQPTLWAAINDDSQPVALLLPVEVTLMNGLLRRLTTRAIAYGSVLSRPGPDGQQALRALLDTYQQETQGRFLFTELRNLSDLTTVQSILIQQGFTYEDHLNYLIDLSQPVDQILQNMGRRTRKKIRKGLRDKVVQMSEVTNHTELQNWYETLQKTYSYSQVPLADHSLFEAAFDELYSKGMAKFLLAQVEGTTAACSIELLYKGSIYGWYGGSDREYSKYLPNEMLIWHILEWGAKNNYRVYDFGGAGKPDEDYGVRDFKSKFGGELVCYGRNTFVPSNFLLSASKHFYQIYRRFL